MKLRKFIEAYQREIVVNVEFPEVQFCELNESCPHMEGGNYCDLGRCYLKWEKEVAGLEIPQDIFAAKFRCAICLEMFPVNGVDVVINVNDRNCVFDRT